MFQGFAKISNSTKGCFASVVFLASTVLCLLGKVDGTAFAAIVSVLGSSYLASHAYQTANTDMPPASLPNKGQP